jgi:hypothetical protein
VERQLVATSNDSCFLLWCENYGLHVVYRLPAGVDVEQVKTHYRSHLPPEWREADDSACTSTNDPPGAGPSRDSVLRLEPNALLLENPRGQRVSIFIEPPTVSVQPPTYACYPKT